VFKGFFKVRGTTARKRRSRRAANPRGAVDYEAVPQQPREFEADAEHGMYPGYEGGYAMEPLTQATYDHSSRPEGIHVKNAILQASAMWELLDIAEAKIEEDWLGTSDDLPGNMYRMAAFGRLFHIEGSVTMFRKHHHDEPEDVLSVYDYVVCLSRIFGAGLIWFFQFFGPPALFMSNVFGWGVPAEKALLVEDWEPFNFTDWEQLWLTKIMGIVFVVAFVMNGIFVVQDEKQSWKKMSEMFRYLEVNTLMHLQGECWLFLDAFTNCWVVVWCCLASAVVMGPATTPQELLFDGLGLLFLYNLDDIDGDFGFLNQDDWPGARLAWIYSTMVQPGYRPTSALSVYNEGADYEYGYTENANCLVLLYYNVTIWLLWCLAIILPFIISITSFTLITPEDY
jgi:hypothetical protein